MVSPRRSSRARGTQPPNGLAHSNSSSSMSSTRGERGARANNKQSSPQKSSTPHSLSSPDDLDDPARPQESDPPETRRRTRGQVSEVVDNVTNDIAMDDDIGDEEEEITRCVCGHQDYPGPPSDAGKTKGAAPSRADPLTEEISGLFIQCDICKVWQHGGCVGIEEEPAEDFAYFCELCRPEMHKLGTSSKGQRFSRYKPVTEPERPKSSHRKSSVTKETDTRSAKEKAAKAAADALTKRRSTMNSRAAYDEDEVLRKVLEESKTEDAVPSTDNGSRKGKRGRDDSEDVKPDIKRQRTNSTSLSPAADSDDDENAKGGVGGAKQKPRGAAARSQREKELREQANEKERQRAEAAARREGRAKRADRRRVDDSELPDEQGEEDDAPAVEAPETTQAPDTPTTQVAASNNTSTKKQGRPPQKKSRLGRNQYTRDRDAPASNNHSISPNRAGPKENSSSPNGANGTDIQGNGSDGTVGKNHKPKYLKMNKTSWNELNRRAGGMLEFIGRWQVEMAEKPTSVSGNAVTKTLAVVNGDLSPGKKHSEGVKEKEREYTSLNTVEMMDALTRKLVLWQQEHGKFAEK